MNRKKYLVSLLFFVFLFSFSLEHPVHAATMYLLSDTRNLNIGQEFNIDVKIDTSDAGMGINSAQATIKFPIGSINAISVDKQNSAFGFWLEEPVVSNSDGTIHFTGGAIKGVTGSAIQILRMKFKVTGAGLADFKIIDAVVTASDGKGINLLSGTQGTSVVVGKITVLPTPVLPGTISLDRPIQVNQRAVLAKELPEKPILRVPLYPDESRWYNRVSDVIVFWDLPVDTIQVSASLSHVKNNDIGTPEKILSNGKSFGILQDGIWYAKVQFKNSIGWGEPVYYKISIDTTVPLPFDIKIDHAVSDNPLPIIKFETNDSLSGIADYNIIIDGKDLISTTLATMKLLVQLPGKHLLTVRANDLAGNGVQDSIEFEILPLPTPKIEFITNSISQGEFAFASGKVMPGNSIEARVVGNNNLEIFRGTTKSDINGDWNMTVGIPLAVGQYLFSVISRDDRGAVSLESVPQAFKVRLKSIISIGFIELSWFDILMIFILMVVIGASLWSRHNLKRSQIRGAFTIILGRDVEKLTDILNENIKELSDIPSIKGTTDPKISYFVSKIKENIDKIKKYIKQEAEKLKLK